MRGERVWQKGEGLGDWRGKWGVPQRLRRIWKQKVNIAEKEGGLAVLASGLLGSGLLLPTSFASLLSGSAQVPGWMQEVALGHFHKCPGLPQPGDFPSCFPPPPRNPSIATGCWGPMT